MLTLSSETRSAAEQARGAAARLLPPRLHVRGENRLPGTHSRGYQGRRGCRCQVLQEEPGDAVGRDFSERATSRGGDRRAVSPATGALEGKGRSKRRIVFCFFLVERGKTSGIISRWGISLHRDGVFDLLCAIAGGVKE